jgi:hypothetical protein
MIQSAKQNRKPGKQKKNDDSNAGRPITPPLIPLIRYLLKRAKNRFNFDFFLQETFKTLLYL